MHPRKARNCLSSEHQVGGELAGGVSIACTPHASGVTIAGYALAFDSSNFGTPVNRGAHAERETGHESNLLLDSHALWAEHTCLSFG